MSIRTALSAVVVSIAIGQVPAAPTLAIVGATIIDGTGVPPRSNGVVLIGGKRILSVGTRGAVEVPPGTPVLDATGLHLTPGFIDVNAHLSVYSGHEAMARYEDRFAQIAVETAQVNLRSGVTTIRDSYGMLPVLVAARHQLSQSGAVGPRVLAAGNVLGWGGPWSPSGPGPGAAQALTLFQERMNDAITQGVGEELMFLSPRALAAAVDAYIDKGPTFIKYGATVHSAEHPYLTFTEAAQRAIVETAHRRGLPVDVHAGTFEALRTAVDAGVDLVQHPEIQDDLLPDELVRLLVERRVTCAIHANMITGPLAPATPAVQVGSDRPATTAEARRAKQRGAAHIRRNNATRLIQAGCRIAVASDSLPGPAPELHRGGHSPWLTALAPGEGTWHSIVGLVDLGMTPMEAIVSATSNGAIASRMSADLGTIEPGKIADLLLFGDNPLANIANIRSLRTVVKDGRLVDRERLPSRPVWTR